MINLQVTTFHMDFSTLDIERGKVAIVPSRITCTIRPVVITPLIKIEGLLIQQNNKTKETKK